MIPLNFFILVYKDFNEDKSELVDMFKWPMYRNLRFGTALHGGFANSTFDILTDPKRAMGIYRYYMDFHVVIQDGRGRRLYEGSIDDIAMIAGGVRIQTVGYYQRGKDKFHGVIYEDATVSEIIKETVTLSPYWDVEGHSIVKTTTVLPYLDFSEEEKLTDVIEHITAYGFSEDGDIRALFFAIWDYRIPYLFPEPDLNSVRPSEYDYLDKTLNIWSLFKKDMDLVSGGSFSRSAKDVKNRIWIGYDDPLIGPTRTDVFEDIASQSIYGVREGVLQIGDAEPGVAEVVGELAIKRFAYPFQLEKMRVIGLVYNSGGYPEYPYMIRAGEVIQESDFDAGIAEVASIGNAEFVMGRLKGLVTRTEYDAERNTLSIDVGTKSSSFEALMTRLGLSPGGM
jgi:hypothetical protein